MTIVAVAVTAMLAVSGDARRAAQLEARGDLAEARAEVEAALAKDPKDATALFVAACLSIEEGRLDDAEARTMELAEAQPVPEVKVLLTLIHRRRNTPNDSLREALPIAWKLAGRPDLSGTRLDGLDESLWGGGLGLELPAGLTPGERFLFGRADSAERRGDALAAALRPDQNSIFLNHELLAYFAASEEPRDPDVAAAVTRVAAALMAADPSNGYWEFVAWLASAPSTAPLAAADLSILERAASRPRFEFPRARILEELRTAARRFDPDHARCRAAMATLGFGAYLIVLTSRAKATHWDREEGANLEHRTAYVMIAIGRRLGDSSAFLERLVGLSMAAKGAELASDSHAAPDARQNWRAMVDWFHEASAAQKKAGTWPFSAMCADWTPDEVGYFGEFVD